MLARGRASKFDILQLLLIPPKKSLEALSLHFARPLSLLLQNKQARHAVAANFSEGGFKSLGSAADILLLKHDSSIFRQSSNPVSGSWKSQASSPWAKQHRA